MPVRHVTLRPDTVATVTVDGDYDTVAVLPYAGTDAVWVNVADTDPTVGGDDCYYVPQGARRAISRPGQTGASDARLISAGAVTVEVEYG